MEIFNHGIWEARTEFLVEAWRGKRAEAILGRTLHQ